MVEVEEVAPGRLPEEAAASDEEAAVAPEGEEVVVGSDRPDHSDPTLSRQRRWFPYRSQEEAPVEVRHVEAVRPWHLDGLRLWLQDRGED